MAIPTGALLDTQAAYAAVVTHLANHGVTAHLADYGGVRTQADTTRILQYRQADYNAAVRAGTIPANYSIQRFRPISPYGRSYHNYGAAFDLAIIARPSGMSEYDALAIAGTFAPSVGLRWGGLFPDPDPDHFELAISLAEAEARYAALTGGAQAQADADPLAYDLSNLLPSLTPSDPPDYLPYLDLSDTSETNDAGEAGGYLANVPGVPTVDQPAADLGLLALMAVTVGAIVWAIRRRYLPQPS